MGSAKLKRIAVLTGCLLAALQGCIHIPGPYLVGGPQTGPETVALVRPCEPGLLVRLPEDITGEASALDPEGFSLMNWNMLKGWRQGWEKDFNRLGRGSDVILLQEAYLTDELRQALRSAQMNWHLATAFRYRGIEAGVLTASEITPQVICMQRFKEPLLNTPKTSLFARFSIAFQRPRLMIVNVHAINYTMDMDDYRRYWQELETILESHDGPLIVAGDFNSWSAQRFDIVVDTARRLGLQPVRFDPDRRTRILGRVVDHVYYRGLVLLKASVYEVTTSDHNPMRVDFKLADAR
ncbi:MAG: endonuclease/exonuclease/phosphatase family protein [Desulfosarcina sp.]|nr:endonuclease/exonuclease/phosphatase family protein [Desulfobacterales bacterium]